MRRVFLLLAAISLLEVGSLAVPVAGQAQVTADQLNKLSLEALTAPPPRPVAAHRTYSSRLYRARLETATNTRGPRFNRATAEPRLRRSARR